MTFTYKDNKPGRWVQFYLLEPAVMTLLLHFAAPIVFVCEADHILEADSKFRVAMNAHPIYPNIGVSIT